MHKCSYSSPTPIVSDFVLYSYIVGAHVKGAYRIYMRITDVMCDFCVDQQHQNDYEILST